MRKTRPPAYWVIYEAAVPKKAEAVQVVCEQAEWDAMQSLEPGQYRLIKAGIATEAEADRQARAGTVPRLTGPRRNQ
jgi:hypothetical protein